MRMILKWLGIVLGSLITLLTLTTVLVYTLTNARFNQTFDIRVNPVEIPTDPESIAYGRHVAGIRSCIACHGDNLQGQIEYEDPLVGRISNANLTTGKGGLGSTYTNEDWVRTIRHGVKPDGTPLLIMPSHTMYGISDEDLGAIIAYVKSVPPVDNVPPPLTLNLLPRFMYLTGAMDLLVPAELIDHESPRPAAPAPGITAEYGQYLTGMCSLCHGPTFSGGPIPGTPPDDPPPLNLTPGGNLQSWSFQDFQIAMRTGQTPDGRQLRPEFMPYPIFYEMTDEELEAIWVYLQSLPAKEFGNR